MDSRLAFHMYGSPAALLQEIRERELTRTDPPGGPPAIMDESGASDDAISTAATVSEAGTANLSWVYWSGLQLHDPTAADPFEALLDQRTRQPHPGWARAWARARVRALAVTYPWATAGTLGPQSFDGATLRFSDGYAVARNTHAPTEIKVPPHLSARLQRRGRGSRGGLPA